MSSTSRRCATLVLVLAAAVASLPAQADHDRRGGSFGYGYGSPFGGQWIGIDGIALTIGDSFGSSDDDTFARPRGVRLRSGLDVTPRFGVEVHGAFARDSNPESFDRVDTWVFAGFLRGSVPLGRAVRLNGLVGAATVGIEQAVNQSEFSDSNGGLAFGVSADVWLGARTSLSGGWTRYSTGLGSVDSVSGFTLGLRIRFY